MKRLVIFSLFFLLSVSLSAQADSIFYEEPASVKLGASFIIQHNFFSDSTSATGEPLIKDYQLRAFVVLRAVDDMARLDIVLKKDDNAVPYKEISYEFDAVIPPDNNGISFFRNGNIVILGLGASPVKPEGSFLYEVKVINTMSEVAETYSGTTLLK